LVRYRYLVAEPLGQNFSFKKNGRTHMRRNSAIVTPIFKSSNPTVSTPESSLLYITNCFWPFLAFKSMKWNPTCFGQETRSSKFYVKVAAASKHPLFGRHKQVAPESAESGHQAPPQGFQQVIQVLACVYRNFHAT
jgi:hypothetical protein